MQKSNKLIIGIIMISIIVILKFSIFQLKSNKEKVETIKPLVSLQKEQEKTFKIGDSTINNPNIIVNPYGNSPLSALVVFKTDEKVEPKVTIKGKDKLSTFSNTFEKTNEHYLPIYGLYPGIETEVIIEYNDIKKKLFIKTDKLPTDFIMPTKVIAKKEKLNNDLYFFTPSSKGYTCAYDVNGDVRWYFTERAPWEINRSINGRLLISTERSINAPYYTTGIYEMDLLGKIYNEFSLEGGYHHDYFEMDNGNLLVASNDFDGEAGTVEDFIVEMDRATGKIIKKFDLKNVLNMEDGQSENWSSYDWFHNNSVWYDRETNSITLSGRHQDAVINIDYNDGTLNWIIGDSTNWSSEYQKYFFKPIGNLEWQWSQHAAMITPEGYVFILDNGNNKSKIKEEYVPATESYTRGVMYKIDTDNMTIKQIWQFGKERGSKFYSPYISDVDYLNKSHYIVHSGGIVYKDGIIQNRPAGLGGATELVSDTVEIKDNEVIFEIILPTNNYRVEKMGLYTGLEKMSFLEPKRLGTLGETKTKNKFGLILNSQKIDESYLNHEIKITKEIDRLVVEGRYKKDNKVNIILAQNFKQKIYNVRVSKKPYTALCIDIFTEEENENGIVVPKYINEDGLFGKYSIYLEMDGIIYNTKKTVKF